MKNEATRLCLKLAATLALALATLHAHAGPPAAGCLRAAEWTVLEQDAASVADAASVLADMARREVVLLGESHDDDDHHRWQVQTLAALHALRPDMVIGFEMFPRRLQPVLDRWVAGELTLKQFLEQAEWETVWNTAPDLYVPLFQFARINRIPMVALNVESTLTKAILEKGLEQVPESRREGVGTPASPPDEYLDFLLEVYRMHAFTHGTERSKPDKKDSGFRHFVESQTTWDRAMAEALARNSIARGAARKPLVVGIMGSGHVRYGHGVPHQLRDLGIRQIGTLLAMPADDDCKEVRTGLANAVFGLPQQTVEKPEPPRLGVRLEENGDGVRLSEVTPGSLADRTGFKIGDVLLEIGGAAAGNTPQVVKSIRRQPPGTWLPVRLKRGSETLDLVIKFPVKS